MNIKVTHYNDYLYSALTGIKTLRIQTETQNKGQVNDTKQQIEEVFEIFPFGWEKLRITVSEEQKLILGLGLINNPDLKIAAL